MFRQCDDNVRTVPWRGIESCDASDYVVCRVVVRLWFVVLSSSEPKREESQTRAKRKLDALAISTYHK